MSATLEAPAPEKAKQEEKEMAPVISRSVEIAREGLVTVPLSDMDPTWIKNYRTQIATEKIVGYRNGAEESGQLTSVTGVWSADGKKVYLCAGFCRLEFLEELALKKVVKEYNDHFGFEKGDEGFISLEGLTYKKVSEHEKEVEEEFTEVEGEAAVKKVRLVKKMVGKFAPVDDDLDTITRRNHRMKIREQGAEWATKFDNALKMATIHVTTKDLGDPDSDDAKQRGEMINIEENDLRTNPSQWDTICRVEKFMAMGKKAKLVAEQTGRSASSITHIRKVYSLPEFIKLNWTDDALVAAFKLTGDADAVKRQTELLVATRDNCLAEYVRRLKLPEGEEQVLKFSAAKEFAANLQATQEGTEPLPIKQALPLFQELVGVGKDGKPNNAGALEYGVFMAKLRDAKRIAKMPEAEQQAAAVAAASGVTTPLVHGSPADPTTVEGLAALQQHAAGLVAGGVAGAAPPAVNGTAGTACTTGTTGTPAKAEATRPEDAAAQAEIKAANAGTAASTEPGLATDAEVNDDAEFEKMLQQESAENAAAAGADPLAVAAAGATPATPEAKPADGQMRSKTTEAVVSRYKVKAPESLEKQAYARLKDAAEYGANLFDVSGCLIAAAELLAAVGMDKESGEINKAYVPFDDAARNYLDKLEEVVAKLPDAERLAIQAMKPKYVPVAPAAAQAAA